MANDFDLTGAIMMIGGDNNMMIVGDDHIGSVLAHAVLLKHHQGLQGSSHEGI